MALEPVFALQDRLTDLDQRLYFARLRGASEEVSLLERERVQIATAILAARGRRFSPSCWSGEA